LAEIKFRGMYRGATTPTVNPIQTSKPLREGVVYKFEVDIDFKISHVIDGIAVYELRDNSDLSNISTTPHIHQPIKKGINEAILIDIL